MIPYTTEELFNNGAKGKFGLYRNPWSPVPQSAPDTITGNANTAEPFNPPPPLSPKPGDPMSHRSAYRTSCASASNLSAHFLDDDERRKRDELQNQNDLANIVGLESEFAMYLPFSEAGRYDIDPVYRTCDFSLYSRDANANAGHGGAGVNMRECSNAPGSVVSNNDAGSTVNTNYARLPVVVSVPEDHGATGDGWETIHQALLMVASGEWHANQAERDQSTGGAGHETVTSALLMVDSSGEGDHANPVTQGVGSVPCETINSALLMTSTPGGGGGHANQLHGEHGVGPAECETINPAFLMVGAAGGGRHANRVHGGHDFRAAGCETINPALLVAGTSRGGEHSNKAHREQAVDDSPWETIDPALLMVGTSGGGGHANEVILVEDSSDEEERFWKETKGKWKTRHEPYGVKEWLTSSVLPLMGQMRSPRRTGTLGYQSQDLLGSSTSPPTSARLATSVQNWVQHNTPLLAEFAARQIHPPLGERVNVELNEPTQFVTGMLQMLTSRDGNTCNSKQERTDLSGCLLEEFVNLDHWAKEYFRGRFGMENVGNDVVVLLTIIANNFYEAHMRLVDAISARAMENMRARSGSHLKVEDFAFGFDLHMAQDVPFFVEASHRVRDTLEAHRPKSPDVLPLPVVHVSRYGRSSRLTKQAEAAAQAELDKVNKARQKAREATTTTNALSDKSAVSNPVQTVSRAAIVTKGRKPSKARGRNRGPKSQPTSSTTRPEPPEPASEASGSQLPTPAIVSGDSNTIRTPSAVVYRTPHYGQTPIGDTAAIALHPSTETTEPPDVHGQGSKFPAVSTSAAPNWTTGSTQEYLESISSALPKVPRPSSRLKITIPKLVKSVPNASHSDNELATGHNLSASNVAEPTRVNQEGPPTRAEAIFHSLFKTASSALGSTETDSEYTRATNVSGRADGWPQSAASGSSGTVRGRSGSHKIVSTYGTRSRVASAAVNNPASVAVTAAAEEMTIGMGTRTKKRKLGE